MGVTRVQVVEPAVAGDRDRLEVIGGGRAVTDLPVHAEAPAVGPVRRRYGTGVACARIDLAEQESARDRNRRQTKGRGTVAQRVGAPAVGPILVGYAARVDEAPREQAPTEPAVYPHRRQAGG